MEKLNELEQALADDTNIELNSYLLRVTSAVFRAHICEIKRKAAIDSVNIMAKIMGKLNAEG